MNIFTNHIDNHNDIKNRNIYKYILYSFINFYKFNKPEKLRFIDTFLSYI